MDTVLPFSEIKSLLDEGKIGLWSFDAFSGETEIHGGTCIHSLFGVVEASLRMPWKAYLATLCHPEDSGRVGANLLAALAENGIFREEYRVWNKKLETWRWVRMSGKAFGELGEAGKGLRGGIQNIQDSKAYDQVLADMDEVDERTRIMLDATPLCSNFWDENYNNIDCNQEAVRLFDLTDKREYLDRFAELSPEYQPNGRLSSEYAAEKIKLAFETGLQKFEWMHRKLNGEPMPSEITLVRVKRGEGYIVAGYTRDLRELKATLVEMREAEERTRIMLDATPLCSNFWDENYSNIDCNQEAVRLFDLTDKREYLDRFAELSPEYQPNGRLSSEYAVEKIKLAFETGLQKFEWMHRKLNGEPMPSEITLVRVKRGEGYIVAGYTRDLRELKATLVEMREAEERTQIMLDATPLCCNFWDENYNNIDCNQEAARLFDLASKQEYLDRFPELSPEYQPNGRLSSEYGVEKIRLAFETGLQKFEWMHQKLSGEPMPSEITLVRVKRGEGYIVAGYTRDLRELKATLVEMREADERTQIMLDATPLCCNFWDENYNNADCNQEAARLFDLASKQEYLDRFAELSPEYQPNGRLSSEYAAEKIKLAFETGSQKFEWMHRKLSGEPIPAEITLVRVKRRAGYIVAGYTRDLRELKATMAEMQRAEEALRLARDVAEKSAMAKSEFLANMSHEIRTPMNAILGMTHLLSQTTLAEKQRDYLSKTEQSASLLLRIINDILDFSKIEAGKLEMEKSPFALEGVLRSLSDLVMGQVTDKHLELSIETEPSVPAQLVGDQIRLKQVLLNLVNNAVKFTPQGRIRVQATVQSHRDDDAVLLFSVSDTGIGMSEEQVGRLFTPFTQADTSTTRKYGGTGLGLAISKCLVNLMEGELWCESKPGGGTTFYFTAQFALAHEEAAAEGAHPLGGGSWHKDGGDAHPASLPGEAGQHEDTQSADLAGVRILLAEDNAINQMIALELLQLKGMNVHVANNGLEALELLETSAYDLVLMDIQMPEMDGIDATVAIRNQLGLHDLPIIAMTAHAMAGDREISLESGMNDHITKPIDPYALYSTIANWVRRGKEGNSP